jgi:hypothetical protein
MLVFTLLAPLSFAGEVTLVIQSGGRPVGAGVSVSYGTPPDLHAGKTIEGGILKMQGVAGRQLKITIAYEGKEYRFEPTFKEDSGWYDVLLSPGEGKPTLVLLKRKEPVGPSPAVADQEPEPGEEQASLLPANWRARMMQAGNVGLPENWKSQLEIETMTLSKAEQQAILKFAQSLRGWDGYRAFMAMNSEQKNACITYPTLRAIARPFAEAKTEMFFDLCMTEEDWDKVKAIEAKDKLLYRQQFGLTATAKDEADWLEIAKGLSSPNWREYRQKVTGATANTVHSNPILRHMFFRYVDAKPEQIEAHQAALRQKEEEARRSTPAWQAAEAERRRKEAEAQEREQREKTAWGKFTLANSYAKTENRSLALLTLKEVIKMFPDTAAGKAAVPLLAKWEKGEWLIQELN